jgi:hypothetical protein
MNAGVFQAAGMVGRTGLRLSRRARGWRVETRAEFDLRVAAVARLVEGHPRLPDIWAAGRRGRWDAVHGMTTELLVGQCGKPVYVDLMMDDYGAIGEAHLGGWIASFRIDLTAPAAKQGRG